MVSLPILTPWRRFAVRRGALPDLLDIHGLPGVHGLRLLGLAGLFVEVATDYTPDRLALLVLAYTGGRVRLESAPLNPRATEDRT